MAQNKPGIHFQGIARNKDGLIIANKQMNIKIGLYKDSIEKDLVYEEIKSIKTKIFINLLYKQNAIRLTPFNNLLFNINLILQKTN